MTITQAERDWLNALWAQAERDIQTECNIKGIDILKFLMQMNQAPPFPFEPLR